MCWKKNGLKEEKDQKTKNKKQEEQEEQEQFITSSEFK
jgi:hypothetical protein